MQHPGNRLRGAGFIPSGAGGASERMLYSHDPTDSSGGTIIGDVIVAHDLEKRFEDLVAVDRITFQVREGEVFGFLGPNGRGRRRP